MDFNAKRQNDAHTTLWNYTATREFSCEYIANGPSIGLAVLF